MRFVSSLHPQSALLTGNEFILRQAPNKIMVNIRNTIVFIVEENETITGLTSLWSKFVGFRETIFILCREYPQEIAGASKFGGRQERDKESNYLTRVLISQRRFFLQHFLH